MKIYIIPFSEKYSKFFQKVRLEKVNYFNETIMSKIEKPMIAILVSKKNLYYCIYNYRPVTYNFLNPEVLLDNNLNSQIISNANTSIPDNEKSEEKRENMSPITSDEEEGLEEGETILKLKNPQNINLNTNAFSVNNNVGMIVDMDNIKSLQTLLNSEDLSFFEEYINTHFSNLSQEDLLSKLMKLDEISRMKLLQLITQYQSKNEVIEEKDKPNEMKNEINDIVMQQAHGSNMAYQQQFVRPQQNMVLNNMMIPQNLGNLFL